MNLTCPPFQPVLDALERTRGIGGTTYGGEAERDGGRVPLGLRAQHTESGIIVSPDFNLEAARKVTRECELRRSCRRRRRVRRLALPALRCRNVGCFGGSGATGRLVACRDQKDGQSDEWYGSSSSYPLLLSGPRPRSPRPD